MQFEKLKWKSLLYGKFSCGNIFEIFCAPVFRKIYIYILWSLIFTRSHIFILFLANIYAIDFIRCWLCYLKIMKIRQKPLISSWIWASRLIELLHLNLNASFILFQAIRIVQLSSHTWNKTTNNNCSCLKCVQFFPFTHLTTHETKNKLVLKFFPPRTSILCVCMCVKSNISARTCLIDVQIFS